MAKVLVTMTFEYEVPDKDVKDKAHEAEIVEEAVKSHMSLQKELNAQTFTIHDIQVEIA